MVKGGMRIVLIGAGRLATNVGKELSRKGHEIVQVYSRTMESAEMLAKIVDAEAVNDLSAVIKDADVYLVAVKDSVLKTLIPELCKGREEQLFAHTAGSIEMNVFKGYAKHYGVFYPMQTFSKEREVDLQKVTCFVEASDAESLEVLKALALTITPKVMELDTEHRRYLHLAAVFACNFANHCFTLSAKVLEEKGIDFAVMLPLIDEMVRKVHTVHPKEAQTGPAARGDNNVMEAQMKLLDDPAMKEIYRVFSKSISEIVFSSDYLR